jgi:hypothetical protein
LNITVGGVGRQDLKVAEVGGEQLDVVTARRAVQT